MAVTWGLVDQGALFDDRAWAGRSEWLRLLPTPMAALALLPGTPGLALNLPLAWTLGVRWRAPALPAGRPAA